MKSKREINLELWIKAMAKTNLSQKHIQMARELNMKPEKIHTLIPKKNDPTKAPLPFFIEECYWKRFKKASPDKIEDLEQLLAKLKSS